MDQKNQAQYEIVKMSELPAEKEEKKGKYHPAPPRDPKLPGLSVFLVLLLFRHYLSSFARKQSKSARSPATAG